MTRRARGGTRQRRVARAALAVAAWALTSGCAPPERGADAGGSDIRARLQALADAPDPVRNRFANTAMLEAMRALPPRASEREELLFRLALAEQTMYAGELDEAIRLLNALRADLNRYQERAAPEDRAPPSFRWALLDFLAAAHLRRSEGEHCLSGAGPVACAVPVPPGAEHTRSDDARTAADLYREMLALDPEHLGARWLLNVAEMFTGRYPQGVERRFLIPPDAFRAEFDIRRFPEVAEAAGVATVGHVGGAVMDDFDGDGLMDLMATSWQLRDPVRYHRNRGDGTFEDLTGSAGLEGLWGGGNLVHADYDNDGDLDVFILRGGWLPDGHPNSLLRNRGDGTFEDVTAEAGLLDPAHPSQTAAWFDYDGDGWLDLFVGNETFEDEPHPSQLFRNLGDGRFVDVAPEVGAAVVGIVKGVAAGDYDDDGRPDLYVSRVRAPNVLLHNDGPSPGGGWSFSDRTREAGVGEPYDAFPVWFWDYDNDGRLDIYVAGYRTEYGDVAAEYLGLPHHSELPRLYRNNGDGRFEDVTTRVRLDRIQFAMGSNYGDLDNDGWLDLYLGTGDAYFQALMPNRAFRNDGGVRFQDVTTAGGFGLLQKGHGVSFGDLDHDGDQDIFQVMGGAYEGDLGRNVLFRNPGHGHRWISLELVGTRSNRSAIGARVWLEFEEGGARRSVHRMVSAGSSFGGSPLRLDVGLGEAEGEVRVRVRWPSGTEEVVEGLRPDAAYRLREGSGVAERLTRRTFTLGGGGR